MNENKKITDKEASAKKAAEDRLLKNIDDLKQRLAKRGMTLENWFKMRAKIRDEEMLSKLSYGQRLSVLWSREHPLSPELRAEIKAKRQQ